MTDDSHLHAGSSPSSDAAPVGGESTVVVVDDSRANIVLLERILRALPAARLYGFVDPRRALAHLPVLDPDLLIVDLHLPRLSGFELIDAVRARTPADTYLPVLVLTADASSETRNRALASGAADLLTKPGSVHLTVFVA